MTRALGVIRLSELTEHSTSPERQREQIETKARQRGSEIIAWAEDLDVSASKVHPMNRPALKAWFDRASEYDEVIFWRLDRFVRRTFPDWADMVAWANEHDVSLVSATEPIDLSGPLPRLMAAMLATVAEMESLNTSERVKQSHEYLRRMKRWGGGRPPFGYKIVDNPGGKGKVLAVNDQTAPYVREAVRRVIAGESVNGVASDFARRKVPAPQAHTWGDTGLRVILRDKALLGHVVYNGESVLGEDGMPIVRAEPLVSLDDWDKLQAALDKLAQVHKRTNTPSLLLGVAFCGRCGGPLYVWTRHNTDRLADGTKVQRGPFVYYRCRDLYPRAGRAKCHAPLINAKQLDAWVTHEIQERYGLRPWVETRTVPGKNYSAETAAVNAAIGELTSQYTRQLVSDDDYDAKMAALRASRKRLMAMPAEPDQVIYAQTGETIAQRWTDQPTVQAKRQMLLDLDVKVTAHRDEQGKLMARMDVPEPPVWRGEDREVQPSELPVYGR